MAAGPPGALGRRASASAGQPAWRNPAIYRQVGLVPEREAVYPFLTRSRVRPRQRRSCTGCADPDAAATRAIDLVDLADAADRRIGTYSKGMRQRIKMAAALVHDPPVLILDEPFNGMDPRQRLHMFELLRHMADEGRTVLLSSHILEEVERIADSVLVIYAGRLAASGDFRSIRRLMTDRPARLLRPLQRRPPPGARCLLAEQSVFGVELDPEGLAGAHVRLRALHAAHARRWPREAGIRCWS